MTSRPGIVVTTDPLTRRPPTGHPCVRLTATDRDHIAVLHALGLWSQASIGAAYGVTRRTVFDIACRRTVENGPVPCPS